MNGSVTMTIETSRPTNTCAQPYTKSNPVRCS